jgi:hypothetical protein
MRSQGFDGFPVRDVEVDDSIQSPGLELTDEEYAATYGFGISTLVSLNGEEMGDPTPDGSAYERYLNERTAAEQKTAIETLNSCRAEAEEKAFEPANRIVELQPRLNELEARIAADPSMQAVVEEVVACMADEGHEIQLDAPYSRFVSEVESILANVDEEASRWAASNEEGTFSPSAELSSRLAELQRQERATALAAWRCQAEVEDQVKDIRAPYEREFMQELGG